MRHDDVTHIGQKLTFLWNGQACLTEARSLPFMDARRTWRIFVSAVPYAVPLQHCEAREPWTLARR